MALFNVRGGAGDITKPDLNARPQDNLYLAVNSEWMEKAKIPSDRSRISSFDGIDLNNKDKEYWNKWNYGLYYIKIGEEKYGFKRIIW